MAWKKASPEQAYLKVGWYGSQGTGKTLTSLMVGEWLVEQANKEEKTKKYRMAFIDTERGTDFYSREVKERTVHPKAFDFDRVITRSVYEVRDLVADMKLDPGVHKVLVIDSMTHLWEAAKEAYTGKVTIDGKIPLTGWGPIKKPLKAIMEAGLNGEFHFMFCGREGLVYEKNEESGEDEVTGYKMKAEGETPYEPHVLIQMYQYRNMKNENWIIKAFFEKDRSGCLTGKTISWPKGDLLEPLYGLLAGKQGTFTTTEDAAEKDASAAVRDSEKRDREVNATFEAIRKAIMTSTDKVQLKAAWELTKGKKKLLGEKFDNLSTLVDARITELRDAEVGDAKAQKGA